MELLQPTRVTPHHRAECGFGEWTLATGGITEYSPRIIQGRIALTIPQGLGRLADRIKDSEEAKTHPDRPWQPDHPAK